MVNRIYVPIIVILAPRKEENGFGDSINNNVNQNSDPVTEKLPDRKIIIQKVENVRIDAIQTPQGPFRRISSLFKIPQSIVEKTNEVAPEIIVLDDAIKVESNETEVFEESSTASVKMTRSPIKLSAENLSENSTASVKLTRSPIKLLSAKMPENCFNQKVPLKMTRVIKKPKPNPILKMNRVHRVQTFKNVEPSVKENVSNAGEVEFKILVPDIEMGELQDQRPIIDNSSKTGSDSDGDFFGFDSKNVEDLTSGLSMWSNLLNCSETPTKLLNMDLQTNVESIVTTGEQPINVAGFVDPITQQEMDKPRKVLTHPKKQAFVKPNKVVKPPPKKSQRKSVLKNIPKVEKSPDKEIIIHKVENVFAEAIKGSSSKISTLFKIPQICVEKTNDDGTGIIMMDEAVKLKSDETEVVAENSTSSVNVTQVNSSVKKDKTLQKEKAEKPKRDEKLTTVKTVFKPSHVSTPSTSKVTQKVPPTSQQVIAQKQPHKVTSWQNDIFVVIGEARIKKIDENLKNIPNLLSDNIYETEIIELKLIVNHLLRKLKVDSVMETMKLASPSNETEGLLLHFL